MLVNANDWEGLAFQIVQLLKQPKLLKTMGQAARKRVEENFDVLTNTYKTAELLKEISLQFKNGDNIPTNNYVLRNVNGNGLSNNYSQGNSSSL